MHLVKGEANPFLGKKHSEDSLALLRAAASDRVHVPVPGLKVEITDLETNVVTSYDSVRKAADALGSDIKTLLRREKNGVTKPYRGRYIIKIKRD